MIKNIFNNDSTISFLQPLSDDNIKHSIVISINFVLFIVKCLDHQLFLDNGHTSYPG